MTYCKYGKSRIFRMHFIIVYFRTRWLSNENKMHTKNPKQVSESAAVNCCTKISCVRKVGGPQTYENLVHTKCSGFTVGPILKSEATRNPDGNLFVKAWMEDACVSKNAKFRRLRSYLTGSYPIGKQTYFFEGIFPKSKWCSKAQDDVMEHALNYILIIIFFGKLQEERWCQVGWSILSIGLSSFVLFFGKYVPWNASLL